MTITTFAGTGTAGYSVSVYLCARVYDSTSMDVSGTCVSIMQHWQGDGGPATLAKVSAPQGVALL